MSSSKKRKLNESSDRVTLSAFAARKTLNGLQTKRSAPSSGDQSQDESAGSVPAFPGRGILFDVGLQNPIASKSSPILPAIQLTATEKTHGDPEDEAETSFQSRAVSPEDLPDTPVITLSTFKPSRESVRELKDGVLRLKLAPGERLVVLGQYEISVQTGQITLLGATLQASKSRYRVSAPLSHSLPVIRCLATDLNEAEVSLYQCKSGLELLKSLSPLFGRLWNDGSRPLGQKYESLLNIRESSFQILFSSDDGPKGSYAQPIVSAPEWNEPLSKLSVGSHQKTPRIFICGPKSSGKSTFARLLSNRLLSASMERKTMSPGPLKRPGVAILDLDPGQPEYGVPGQLSLVHIEEPNFGPPYSHPIPEGTCRIVRAHSIAANTPSMDPSLYMACALDLFSHYRNLLSRTANCPLVINTPGWVLGTGLEILLNLIAKLRPTEVIYMSQEGPWEVVESLRDAVKRIPVLTLPSQVSKYVTKTAAHLRTMQAMSYFHVNPTSEKELSWSAEPLSSIPPWEIRYSGKNAGLLGVICYGEQPAADLLLESINGSLLAVVVIDDMEAIPGWQTEIQDTTNETDHPQSDHSYSMETGATEIRALDDETLEPQHLERPLIVQTPKEDIPYFNPANAISLDPKHSHCIGLVLVRGIDITRRRLQVITPISPNVIEEINEARKPIVLVGGRFDNPGWTYTEELMQKDWLEKVARKKAGDEIDADGDERDEESDGDDDDGDGGRSLAQGFRIVPWVERQEGSQGRAFGSQVWRVRRDLGKSGD